MLPGFLAAALPAIGNIAGNLFGQSSARREARHQERYQTHMANTQYQRGMADMKAAGLNPILAYQKGGASAPSGTKADIINPADNVSSSALAARSNIAQVKNLNAQNELIKAQTFKTVMEGRAVETTIPRKQLIERGFKALDEHIAAPAASSAKSYGKALKDTKKAISSPDFHGRSPLDLFLQDHPKIRNYIKQLKRRPAR